MQVARAGAPPPAAPPPPPVKVNTAATFVAMKALILLPDSGHPGVTFVEPQFSSFSVSPG
jgi:hypothetical protein